MLSRPLTLNDSDDRGRVLAVLTPPPVLPLVDEGDGDDETQTGVFSPAPPWSSSSASPPPCASTSFSIPSLTPPAALSFTCLPRPLPPLCLPHPTSLPCSPLSSLSPPPPVALSLLSSALPTRPPPPPPPSPSVFSAPFISPSPPVSSPLPPPSSSSFTPPTSTPPATFSGSPLPSSSPSVAPSLHPPPPSLLSHPVPLSFSSTLLSPPPVHDYPPFPSALAPLRPLLYHHSSSAVSPPPPPFASSVSSPPPPSASFTPPPPHSSAICSPLSSSSAHVPPSLISPPPPVPPLLPHPPVAASLICSTPSTAPAPPPPPCCPCSSLLPRLLSAHRLEVRRLLRGALASLGRRLDSLERRSRGKRRKKRGSGQRGEEAAACSPAAFASSGSPAPIPPVTSSSPSSPSSDSEDSSTLPLPCCVSQSDQRSRGNEEEVRGGKRRRKDREEDFLTFPKNREDEEEEEDDPGRFIGRMAFSFGGGGGGAEKEAPLTLHNFNQRKHTKREEGGTSQSVKAVDVIVRPNGHRAPLWSISSSSSQDALHLLQSAQSIRTCSQSKAPGVSASQWRFSDTPPLSPSSNHSAFCLWLRSYSSPSFSPAPVLRLSAVAVETMTESVRGGAVVSPLQPLKDWSAPPSLSSDHCYVRTPTLSLTFSTRRQQKQWANHSTRNLHPPRRRPLPLPSCSANGLSAAFPASQSAVSSEFVSTNRERGKRVSQIRIRRASPRETPLTPMGLPKVKRLKKKEFSLEEIYTNKNYKSPTTNRSLETIFEEPREKDGALLLIGQQRRRRLLLFPDFTQPRKRKRPQGAGIPVATVLRKRAAARRHCHGDASSDDDTDLDVMLVERLSALEDFLTRQGLEV